MRLHGVVPKGWGEENIFVSNDKYCGKLMKFNQQGQCSMHFHAEKDETWYVMSGEFIVTVIDTTNAKRSEHLLLEGDVWHNAKLSPHQLTCQKPGVIIEVSTPDSVEDNYRVAPGDSQK